MVLISSIGTKVAGSPLDKFGEGQILFYKLNQEADIISTGLTCAIVQPCGLIMVVGNQKELVVGHDDKMTGCQIPSHERTPVFWEFVAQAFLGELSADPNCHTFELDSTIDALSDVGFVRDEITASFLSNDDLESVVWHCLLFSCLRAGSPGQIT